MAGSRGTNCAMDVLSAETKKTVLSTLRKFSIHTKLCECDHDRSFLLRLENGVVKMGSDSVVASVCICETDLGFTKKDFLGYSLQKCTCMDVDQKYTNKASLKMTAAQWDLIASKYESFLAIAVGCKNKNLDATKGTSALMSVHPTHMDPGSGEIVTGELFAGGIGGWSFAQKALTDDGHVTSAMWALDQDFLACKSFQMNHKMDHVASSETQAWGFVQADTAINLCPTVLFQTKIENIWWMTFLEQYNTELVLMSPPCPAWSMAHACPGLDRSDGLCLIVVIILMAFVRPRVWGLENVAALKLHKHFDIIMEVVRWTNFQIQWMKCCDLLEQTPQHRDRLLVYAVNRLDEALTSHKPVGWPIRQSNTLGSCKVVCQLDAEFMENARLSDEDLAIYLNPENLPKEMSRSHKKRCARDVVTYRLRTIHNGFACVMTTYGRPDAVGEHLIDQGGIYGSLYHDGNLVRKLSPPELCILFHMVDECWLPKEEYISVSFLGNCISIPHATILLLNMIACVRPFWVTEGIDKIFTRTMSDPINSSNISIDFEQEGYWVRKRKADADIPATQEVYAFAKLSIQSPLQAVAACLQEGIMVHEVLKAILGSSMPCQFDIRVSKTSMLCVQMHPAMTMPTGHLQLHTAVPCCFMPTDQDMLDVDWPFVAVMTKEGLVIIKRGRNLDM